MWLYVTFFISFFFNHIVSNLGLSGTWDLKFLGPYRIISRTYSAEENSPNQFIKCARYILIVKVPDVSLEVSMERLFDWRADNGISCGGYPLSLALWAVIISYRRYEKGLMSIPHLFLNLVVALVRYLFFVYKNIESYLSPYIWAISSCLFIARSWL